LAQSRGLWPGASATLARFFLGRVGICVVVDTESNDPDDEDDGADRLEEDAPDADNVPGLRLARCGAGGGGIKVELLRIRILDAPLVLVSVLTRCALDKAGKAGGVSVSVLASLSSSASLVSIEVSSGGGITSREGKGVG
jgi:hypothetical protein